jgi:hypothetical protein
MTLPLVVGAEAVRCEIIGRQVPRGRSVGVAIVLGASTATQPGPPLTMEAVAQVGVALAFTQVESGRAGIKRRCRAAKFQGYWLQERLHLDAHS